MTVRRTRLRPRSSAGPTGRRGVRRARHRRRHHRRGVALDAAARGLRTALVERDDFASGTSSKSSKLVHGGLRYLQQKEYLPRLREPARAPAPARQRAAPRRGPAVPHPAVRQGRRRQQGGGQGVQHRAVALRPHRRHAHRQAPQAHHRDEALAHMPTLRSRPPRRRVPVLRRRRPTTPGSRSTIARTAVLDHGAVARQPRAGRPASLKDATAGHRARIEPSARRHRRCGPTVVVNAAGVWADDVRALDEGADPRLDPAGQGHPPHGARGDRCRCDIAAVLPVPERPALDLRRAVGRPRLPRHHRHRLRRARSTTRSAPPRTSPTCSTRSTPASPSRSPRPTCSAPGRACARSCKGAGSRSAPPTCRGDTRVAHVRPCGRGHGHRRQAHDLPEDGRGHRRRGRQAARRGDGDRRQPPEAPAAPRGGHRGSADRRPRPPRRRADRPRPSGSALRQRGRATCSP